MSYLLFSYTSILVILFAGGMALYHILGKINKSKKDKKVRRRDSIYPVTILILPFVFGSIMSIDGYLNSLNIIQAVFIWTLTLSFWQTMLFVPLAIRSVHKESQIPYPKVFKTLSILVPAYNEERVIHRTLNALLYADYPNKEIIVIDDGSKDRTLEMANQYKDRVKVLHKQNGGKASALNYGLAYSKGDIVVIVDADTIIAKNALKNIVKNFNDKNVSAVAGNIKISNRCNWLTWCQALEYLSGIQVMRRGLDYFDAITIVPGALGAFRKEVLLKSGSYNKDTLVEDFDATLKILKSGTIIKANNDAIVYTQAPQTLKDFYNQRKRWYRGNLQVLRRHSDALTNSRFGFLHKFSYPLMAIHMIVMPITGILVWVLAAVHILNGGYYFVFSTLFLFVILQSMLTAMSVRMDKDDMRIVLFSVFMVVGFKQITDILQIRAVFEELFNKKATWTSAKRIRT
jgi:cellulose synthase/poly-beta-1,6-N-acetylglucosamine synthase-like glycosyltransferase